jgi:heptaprenyl diphosphate synthase
MSSVDSFVLLVENNLRLQVERTPVTQPTLRLLQAGGKRLRARLVFLAARASARGPLSPDDSALIRAATAIELAHLGSLIHDDIVDGGDTRRGVPTLHCDYGVRIATDAGAALAHLATELVAPLGDSARRAVRRALLATCRGQIRELATSFVMLSPRRRFAIMQEKTGALFELAAALGATVGHGSPHARSAVCRFARRFGVAFQIADDVFDLAGDPSELGRANGADLRDGVATLPVALTFDPDGFLTHGLAQVRVTPDAKAISACADIIARGGGIERATVAARSWLEHAVRSLATLQHTSEVAALIELAEASVERGLRPGRPTFTASHSHARTPGMPPTPFMEPPTEDMFARITRLDVRLRRVLEWFHPGLSFMVAARAFEPAIDRTHQLLRKRLMRGGCWSPEATLAADAITLAHALARDDALRTDAVRTLAMVDALHCAAIAFLSVAPRATEHEDMAARAGALLIRSKPPQASSFRPSQQEPAHVGLSQA